MIAILNTVAAAFIFAALSVTAPANSVAPEVTEQSVAYEINVARAKVGEEPLTAKNGELQELCEGRAERVVASNSPAKAIVGEAIGRVGRGATAEDVVETLLAVDEYREALLSTNVQQMGVAVVTDDFGYPIIVVMTAAE